MDSIHVVIVEDELIVAEDLKQTLQGEGYDVIATFDAAEKALPFLLKTRPDLMLADIRLKGEMNGIELVSAIQASYPIPTIFITANSDEKTYQEARKTKPQAFLVKPFNSRTLLASVDLALYNFANNHVADSIIEVDTFERKDFQAVISDGLFIRANGKHKKIRLEDLLFIEADGSYIKLVTAAQQYTITHNLSDFLRRIHLPNLTRVHRSYILNVNRVESFDESYAYIQEHKIPISKGYRSEFLALLNAI